MGGAGELCDGRRRGALQRWVAMIVGLALAGPAAAVVTTFSTGSLIIPMDTGTSGQNNGMLTAYGLVYQLLRNGVPVAWVINPAKPANGDDFSVSISAALQDVRTGATLAPRSYRGGPFLVASADAAAALPIVQAFQAVAGDQTAVHRLVSVSSINVDVARFLVAAPRLAVVKDGNEMIVFNDLNAARIADSVGGVWNPSSPDLLTEADIVGPSTSIDDDGVLFNSFSPRVPRYCHVTSMHTNASINTSEVVQETRQWLDRSDLTQLFLQCQSSVEFEGAAGGQYLTSSGLTSDGLAPNAVAIRVPAEPAAQLDGAFAADSGAIAAMKANGVPPAYKAGVTTLINESAAALTDRVVLLTGRLDGNAGNGRVTYLAGHDYTLDVPISSNPQTNGVRLFLNSLFTADCATMSPGNEIQVAVAAPQYSAGPELGYTVTITNAGARPVENLALVAALPAGATFVSAVPAPTSIGSGVVRWNLPNLAVGGVSTVTLQLLPGDDGVYATSATLDAAAFTLRHVRSNTASTTLDRQAPAVFLAPGNPTATADTTPTFGFTLGASLAPAHAECRIDGGPFAFCISPFTAPPLADGAHQFEVFGSDAAGNQSPPALASFVVDTVAPVVEIAGPPLNPLVTGDATPALFFSILPGSAPDSAECRVFAFSAPGATPFVPCNSPYTPAPPLGADGVYLFEVRATDAAGNAGDADLFGFQLDTGRPRVVALDSVARAAWSGPGVPGIAAAVTRILVRFDDDMATTGASSVLDAANWRLIGGGADLAVQTTGCSAVSGDDELLPLAGIEREVASATTELVALAIAAEAGVPAGRYRLFACATLTDIAGNPLAGGGAPAGDAGFDFRVLRTPRLANPNFDAGLDGWSLGGPVPAEWTQTPLDGEGQPFSGAARLATGVGAGASWQIEQCLDLAAAEPLAAFGFGALVRVDSGEGGAPAVRAYHRWHDAAACGGSVGGSASSTPVTGDTAGSWRELALRFAPPPPGAQSLLVGFGVLGGTASAYTVDIDRVQAPATLLLFADGFASSDLCEWSAAVGGAGC